MTKIQNVSRYFRLLFQFSFAMLLSMEILTWCFAPSSLRSLDSIGISTVGSGYLSRIMVDQFSPLIKLEGFTISMLSTGIELLVLYFLIKLFQQYERGVIFTTQNVRYIRNIGVTLLIGQLIHPIYEALMGTVITWSNGPGRRMFAISILPENIKAIIGAFLIILISWVLAESCKLHEEQQLTV